jgi:hypothetical protein
MMNRTSYKIQHHHILCFLLVRDLTTIFLLSGLGVEDKRMALAKSRSYSMRFIFFFYIWSKQDVYQSKARTLHGLGQEIGGTFVANPVTS